MIPVKTRSMCVLITALVALSAGAATATEEPATVPLLMNGQVPAIEVMISGEGPFRFDLLFATGSSEVTAGLADKLGLKAGDGDMVSIESLRVGGTTIDRFTAKVVDPDDFGGGSDDTVGVLTLDVFEGLLLTLDLVQNELGIRNGVLSSMYNEGVLDYGLVEVGERVVPGITLSVGDQRFDAFLNSMVQATIHFPTDSIDALPLAQEPRMMGRIVTPKGSSNILGAKLTSTLRLGDASFPEARLRFSDLFERPSLGLGALGDYKISFDPANRRLRLHEPEKREMMRMERAAAVANIIEGEADLRAAFNNDKDKTRLVMILSPT